MDAIFVRITHSAVGRRNSSDDTVVAAAAAAVDYSVDGVVDHHHHHRRCYLITNSRTDGWLVPSTRIWRRRFSILVLKNSVVATGTTWPVNWGHSH